MGNAYIFFVFPPSPSSIIGGCKISGTRGTKELTEIFKDSGRLAVRNVHKKIRGNRGFKSAFILNF
ncbi:hypothetical protein GCM10010917_00150 [Paenibacillus physcomitrellae]|uniref:Uncharacterized protein n=1 Tax=Paenibacillus physcomitrellae TaxID=1619311 RepID=A0ABQ1FK58_9BACL|nr:hypothetical protein GCM10010917_00150 [Paenibacillus physcomitrellae]